MRAAAADAVAAERAGYDGWTIAEARVDPFLACAVGAERSERIELATGVAIALARSPMTVALQAYDIQALSRGRFSLGLGSQVKPHVTKRFSMPWSRPAARMREYVLALRAIWQAWETGEPLRFEGDFYTHTLMTPFFSPGPNRHGPPPIHLGAIGPKMTAVAGEVADGLICHPFSTERYVREVTMPAVRLGRERIGATLDGFELSAPGFAVVAESEQAAAAARESVKRQIGFYGSTPAYRPVLELHGWGDLQEELNLMTKRSEWDRLETVVSDDVLQAFAVIGTKEELAVELERRWAGLATRVSISTPEFG
ncbi:MAG: TIGR03617 family F420-dependent LLM class oxidoreductase [Actinobacteria bacterium]|nr:TIGR03617 family F420-dependent LLM class oxidoreductase [Actinomycetota bacterium]